MADFRKVITKMRKPIFWFQNRKQAQENAKVPVGGSEQRRENKRYQLSLVKCIPIVVLAAMLAPRAAHGQFGIDVGVILAALSKMQSFMNQYMAAPLKDINTAQQSISKYEQEVIYPAAAITQAKSYVTQFEGNFSQIGSLFHVNVSSATLPQSQALESVLLSRTAGNVSTVSSQFQNVYGVVMPQNAASPNVRNMTDMTDAQAQDAMKRAIQVDAISDQELAVADQIGQQIAAAAPGSAPILEAEADVWNVRANAYTQSALAELMRIRGIDIANQSKLAKLGSSDATSSNSLINGALTHK